MHSASNRCYHRRIELFQAEFISKPKDFRNDSKEIGSFYRSNRAGFFLGSYLLECSGPNYVVGRYRPGASVRKYFRSSGVQLDRGKLCRLALSIVEQARLDRNNERRARRCLSTSPAAADRSALARDSDQDCARTQALDDRHPPLQCHAS